MNRIELQVNEMPITFTRDSVTYNNKEFFYNSMESIKHINNDTPSLMFMYDGESVQIPYEPSDKSIMEQVFKEIKAASEPRKATPLSPSTDELEALFAGLQPQKQVSVQQPQQQFSENVKKYSKTNTFSTREIKNQKLIFKRWWFIVIVILIALLIAYALGSGGDTKKNPSTAQTNTSGNRTNPADPTKGITVNTQGKKFYFKLDKVLKNEDAIERLKSMGQWENFEDYDKTKDIVFFVWTVKAISGFSSEALEGWSILDESEIYDGTCSKRISLFPRDIPGGRWSAYDIDQIGLYDGKSSEMTMLGYPDKNMHSFCTLITNNDFEDYYVKYTF